MFGNLRIKAVRQPPLVQTGGPFLFNHRAKAILAALVVGTLLLALVGLFASHVI